MVKRLDIRSVHLQQTKKPSNFVYNNKHGTKAKGLLSIIANSNTHFKMNPKKH